jgi:hypothetical protein
LLRLPAAQVVKFCFFAFGFFLGGVVAGIITWKLTLNNQTTLIAAFAAATVLGAGALCIAKLGKFLAGPSMCDALLCADRPLLPESALRCRVCALQSCRRRRVCCSRLLARVLPRISVHPDGQRQGAGQQRRVVVRAGGVRPPYRPAAVRRQATRRRHRDGVHRWPRAHARSQRLPYVATFAKVHTSNLRVTNLAVVAILRRVCALMVRGPLYDVVCAVPNRAGSRVDVIRLLNDPTSVEKCYEWQCYALAGGWLFFGTLGMITQLLMHRIFSDDDKGPVYSDVDLEAAESTSAEESPARGRKQRKQRRASSRSTSSSRSYDELVRENRRLQRLVKMQSRSRRKLMKV